MTGEVLLQLETSSRAECEIITKLPVERTIRITVATDKAAANGTEADARTLFAELRYALSQMGGTVGFGTCQGQYQGTGKCHADQGAPREHNVLVVVEDPQHDIAAGVLAAFRRFPSHVIVPLVEQGSARAVPSQGIARHIMLQYAPGSIGAMASDILVSAGVGADAFRVFISYMHDDAAAAAAGVFHHLAEARFAVFLDRFSGLPGQDFLARINSELFDKSCVVVLETPNVKSSSWVCAEVNTARTHHLGLLAIDLPGSTRAFHIAPRLDCTSLNGTQPLGRNGVVPKADLDRIVDFVRTKVPAQGMRRRRWQRRTLASAVALTGITDLGITPLGRHLRGPGRDYQVGLTARPPDAAAFKSAYRATTPPERGVLFGPLSHQMVHDAAITSWLDSVSGVRAFDEGLMVSKLYQAKAGQL